MRKQRVDKRDFYTNNSLPMTTPTLPHVLIHNSQFTLKLHVFIKHTPLEIYEFNWEA